MKCLNSSGNERVTIYLSSGAFKTSNLEEMLGQADTWGLRTIELSSGVSYAPGIQQTVEKFADRFDFLVHNYFPPPDEAFVLNLGADDPDILERSKAHCRGAIDLSVQLGASFYSVHSGFAMNMRPNQLGKPDEQGRILAQTAPAYETAYARFVESVTSLCDYADGKGVDFVIENNVLAPALAAATHGRPLLMVEADEICKFFADVAHPRLGLLVDTGHAKVSAYTMNFAPEYFLETVSDHIRAFHLSDNDGQADQNLMYDERAWFATYLRHFPETPIVIETYRLDEQQMRDQLALTSALQTGQLP